MSPVSNYRYPRPGAWTPNHGWSHRADLDRWSDEEVLHRLGERGVRDEAKRRNLI